MLTDPHRQIESHVFDVIRSTVPLMSLDELFESKTKISNAVDNHLRIAMIDFGYDVLKTLVVEIRPAESVRQAMNEMNASKRLKVAMMHHGEAEKIKKVKEAEANAEALYLQGVGIGGKQRALAQGLRTTFETEENSSSSRISYSSRQEIANLVLIAQYSDVLTSLSRKQVSNETSNLVLPADPGQILELTRQVDTFS
jgi:regulator of protease activity HflC (stomatin/prohibitin superfamily)